MTTALEMKNYALFDLDGTLCDFEGSLRRQLASIRTEDEPDYLDPNVKIFDPGILSIKRHMILKTPGFWRSLEPIALGMELVQAAQKIGFEVNVLTKGPDYAPNAWSEKLEWCKQHLPGVPVTITQNKGIVYGRILVDDYPENMEIWLPWRLKGLGLMADSPYNKNFSHPRVFKYNEENIDEAIALMAQQLH